LVVQGGEVGERLGEGIRRRPFSGGDEKQDKCVFGFVLFLFFYLLLVERGRLFGGGGLSNRWRRVVGIVVLRWVCRCGDENTKKGQKACDAGRVLL